MVLESKKIKFDKYKSFLWDFDGTLFDTYPIMTDAFVKALSACGVKVDFDEVLSLLSGTFADTVDYYKTKYNLADNFIDIYINFKHLNNFDDYNPFPFAKEILEKIIANGGKNLMFTHRGESVFEIMKIKGFYDYFTEIATTDMGFERKPSPEGVNYLLDKYSIDKSTAIYIGDRKIDVEVGKNASISTCLIDNFEKKEFYDADFHFNNLQELFENME